MLHPEDAVGDRAMGVERALGAAGRAGRVDHVGEVVAVQRGRGVGRRRGIEVERVGIDDDHVCVGLGQRVAQMLLGEKPAQLRVVDHVAHALGGVVGVDGDVRRRRPRIASNATLMSRERSMATPTSASGPTPSAMVVCEAVGAQVEFGVGERGVIEDGSDGVRRALDLLFEQPMQRLRGGLAEIRVGAVPLDRHQVPLRVARQRQLGDGGRRIVREMRRRSGRCRGNAAPCSRRTDRCCSRNRSGVPAPRRAR